MGTGPISNNDDNKMPLGKEYWAQQAENNLNNDGKTWKAPDGSNNVPVGKTEAEVKQSQNYDDTPVMKDLGDALAEITLAPIKLLGKFIPRN